MSMKAVKIIDAICIVIFVLMGVYIFVLPNATQDLLLPVFTIINPYKTGAWIMGIGFLVTCLWGKGTSYSYCNWMHCGNLQEDKRTIIIINVGENSMSSSKDYLEYILDQLSGLDDISYRAMMGEYIIYYCGKVVGGIYDDRFLVKPVKAAVAMMPDADLELPYEGAKKMLLVDDVENREFLRELLDAMCDELPAPKKK